MKIISEYIAPWALSKEEIPIHLVWDPSFEYESIRIEVPSGLTIKDLFNVQSFEKGVSSVAINALKTSNYFGFLVMSQELPKEPHIKKEIKVEFISSNNVKYSHSFVANIYRPILSLIEPPKTVTFSDESDFKNLINIPLKLYGFGRIRVRFEISTGGEFRTHAQPLYRELLRRMISTFELTDTSLEKKGDITINALYLQKTSEAFIEKMKKGELPLDIRKEDLDDFQKWVSDETNRAQLTDLVSRHLENLLIDSLLFYFEKHPMDYVELTQGNPITVIERATQELRIRVRYWDSLENEYEPVEISIPIEDVRKDKTREIELPINIHWEQELINPLAEVSKCPT